MNFLRKDNQLRSCRTGYQTKQPYSKAYTSKHYVHTLPGKWGHFWCLNPVEELEMKSWQGSLSKNLKDKEDVGKDSYDGTSVNQQLDLQFKCRSQQ